jgi:hypothetical protein
MEDLRALEIPVPMPLRRAEALLSVHIRKIERAQNVRVAIQETGGRQAPRRLTASVLSAFHLGARPARRASFAEGMPWNECS